SVRRTPALCVSPRRDFEGVVIARETAQAKARRSLPGSVAGVGNHLIRHHAGLEGLDPVTESRLVGRLGEGDDALTESSASQAGEALTHTRGRRGLGRTGGGGT